MSDDPRRWGELGDQNPSDPGQVARALLASIRGAEVGEIPARLCELCAELLPVSGASISLMVQTTARRILSSSDGVSRQLAELQYTLGDGPCMQACSNGAPVFAADLSNGADSRRWPVFALRALEAGAKAVFSFPLAIGAIAAGTLDLYRNSPGSLSERDVSAALLIADTATLEVLRLYARQGETGGRDGDEAEWLADDVDHDEVHHATGIVMIQLGVGAEEALLVLRARAFTLGTTLNALAYEVVTRRVRFDGAEDV